jgi:hypothetical protein
VIIEVHPMCNMLHKTNLVFLLFVASAAPGCVAEADGEETDSTTDELRAGVNGAGCKRSPYNCGLNPKFQRLDVPTWEKAIVRRSTRRSMRRQAAARTRARRAR